jgi:hypothetical protein
MDDVSGGKRKVGKRGRDVSTRNLDGKQWTASSHAQHREKDLKSDVHTPTSYTVLLVSYKREIE